MARAPDGECCGAVGVISLLHKELVMKRLVLSLAVAALALAAAPASADLAMAKKYNCLACHAVDHKVLGPAYKDVARKYAGQKGVEEKLVKKVETGGSGVWGNIPMPPNSSVPDADVRSLVKWILSLK
jgi:cytochrome c